MKRFWELDSLRGAAVVMMVLFHLIFDLTYFLNYNFQIDSGFWLLFARATAAIFILLVGISLSISYSKDPAKTRLVKRGLKIFGYGLIITAVTWFLFKENFIFFGILHFIGFSIILSTLFLRQNKINLPISAAFILGGFYLSNFRFDFPWLAWLGFEPRTFYTFDYFSVFPWFGLILFGIFFGKHFYGKNKRVFEIKELGHLPIIRQLCFLGRNSLAIYFIHQPILIAILYILGLPIRF